MAGHFETLLDGIAADPDTPISRMPMLTSAERHQLMVEWNDTRADYPSDALVQSLFEDQVARQPEAVAAVFGDTELHLRAARRPRQSARASTARQRCP